MPALLDAPKTPVSAAARRFGVHVSTLHRWAAKGVGGVRLPITRIGGRSYVLDEDLERFIARRSDPRPVDEAAASRRADEAGRALDAIGL